MKRKSYIKKAVRFIGIFLLVYLIYFILGVTLPFIKAPVVSDDFAESFSSDKFYGDSYSVDRAAVIESSQDALDIRLHMLNSAKKEIIISSFSVKHDRSCKEIFSTVLNVADRGVKVQILIDGLSGTYDMNNDTMYYVLGTHPNIEIRYYNRFQPLKPWTFNGRMHDKYIIIDDELLLLGGRNLSNYFLGEYNTKVLSYDRDIFVYNTAADTKNSSDSVITQVKEYFETIWNSKYNDTVYDSVPFYKKSSFNDSVMELVGYYDKLVSERPELFTDIDYQDITVPTNKITLISNPIHIMSKEPYVWYQMQQLMLNAKERVYLQSPYAVLNDAMYQGLEDLENTVPDVTLMLNSTAGGDNFMASSDYTWNKDKVIDTGVDLYEFQGKHSMHNKSVLIDDNLSIVGSYNLDMRSTYLDTEVMLVVHGEEFNRLLELYIDSMEQTSLPVLSDGSYGKNNDVEALTLPAWKKITYSITSFVFQLFRYLL